MTGRLSDGQLFAAVLAGFLAAEAVIGVVAIVAWRHHKTRQPKPGRRRPYDWKQDDRNLSLRSHVRIVRAVPPASGRQRPA